MICPWEKSKSFEFFRGSWTIGISSMRSLQNCNKKFYVNIDPPCHHPFHSFPHIIPQLREAVAPFIAWLQEAEEDSDE